jgi:hypothetical protein
VSEDVDDIGTAKTAAVVHHRARFLIEGGGRQKQAGAGFVRLPEIGLTGDEAVIEAEHTEGSLHETGHRETVASQGFGAANGRLMALEKRVEGAGFRLVPGGGGRGVGIDMINVLRRQSGVTQREAHGAQKACAFGVRAGGMQAVAGLTPTGDHGLNTGSALLGAGGGF